MAVAGSLTYDTKLDSSGFNKGLNALGKASGTAFKGIATAVGVATTAITGLVSASVKAYADFEQLEGGVKKLFGEDAKLVFENANKAFETAGISANQYMETVTGISANLIKSLGDDTKKSAEYAQMAIEDMADNANTFGTSMEDVQNVYSALARGMYVTLDNLKLGYAGTKAGAQQMIDDANRIKEANGEMANLSVENYADLVEAIHIAQKQLNITGTTAKEASTTIQGSFKKMKGAWQDLVAGMSKKDADVGKLIQQFIDSVATFADNLLPVVEKALLGVGDMIEQLLPSIAEKIPNTLAAMLPKLATAGVNMVKSLVKGIIDNLPELIKSAGEIINTLVSAIVELLPDIIKMGFTIIVELARGLGEALPTLIPKMVDAVVLIVKTLIDNIDLVIDAGITLILGLAEGLINAIPQLIEKVPEIIEKLIIAFIENLPKLVAMGIVLIIKLAEGLIKAIPQLLQKVPEIISAIINGVKEGFGRLIEIGKQCVRKIWEGIQSMGEWLGRKFQEFFSLSVVQKATNKAVEEAKKSLGIQSPSKVFRDEVGKYIPEGVAVGIEANTDSAIDSIDKMNDEIVRKMGDATAIEMGKMALSGTNGSVNEILNANGIITVENYNTLELDGEQIYENQQTITQNKNLQYAFGGAR